MTPQAMSKSDRRRFLGWSGLAAASLAAAAADRGRLAVAADEPANARTPGKFLKLGIASYTFRHFDLEKTLAMTQRAGLQYVCLKSMHLSLDATPEKIAEVAKQVADTGLTLYGAGVITMSNETQVHQAFAYGKAAGMKTLVASPAPAMLPLIDEKVKALDIAVAIHNHGPGDKVFPTPESAYEQVKGFDRRLGLCMDIGHTVRIGADPVAAVERFADRLLDIHIKDVTEASPKGQCIQLGRGVIDIPAFLRALVKVNYAGVLSYEYEADERDPLPGLAECVGYTRGVLAVI